MVALVMMVTARAGLETEGEGFVVGLE